MSSAARLLYGERVKLFSHLTEKFLTKTSPVPVRSSLNETPFNIKDDSDKAIGKFCIQYRRRNLLRCAILYAKLITAPFYLKGRSSIIIAGISLRRKEIETMFVIVAFSQD